MAKKLTSLEQAQERVPSNITLLTFNGRTEKCTAFCTKHNNQFDDKFNSIVSSAFGRCPDCKKEVRLKSGQSSGVTEKLKKKYPDIQIEGDYQGIDSKCFVICDKHGKQETSYRSLLHHKSVACPVCANEQRSNTRATTIHDKMSEGIVGRFRSIHGEKYDYTHVNYVSMKDKVKIICKEHGEFEQLPLNHLAGDGCPRCSNHVSKAENTIADWIRCTYGLEVIQNDRKIIGPKEIDIIVPEKKIAIEYNGVYWHSSDSKTSDRYNQKRHIEKTELMEQQGYQLFHIFDNEPLDKWMSVLENALGCSKRVYARQTTPMIIPKALANEFCNQNHLQGECLTTVAIGLYHKDELVSVMTFGTSRFNRKVKWELLRFCNRKGMTVVGGASKLIKFFRKNYEGSIVSYANRRWSTGNLYRQIGFKEIHVSAPCYWYIDRKGNVYHRSKYMKHKLKNILDDFDPDMSEVDNMYNNGYRRIWDSGNYVFIME